MVSIDVSKAKFDRIANKQDYWINKPDTFSINFRAKSSLSFCVNFCLNDEQILVPALKSVKDENDNNFLEKTLQMSVDPKFGENYIDLLFSCDNLDDKKMSAQQKSIEIDNISINNTLIEQSKFGMDNVSFQSGDLSYLTPDEQEKYRYALLRKHGGYFGFFGRIRFPYYRFMNAKDVRIYKRNDYGVDCNNHFTVIYDKPPRKTKDFLKND